MRRQEHYLRPYFIHKCLPEECTTYHAVTSSVLQQNLLTLTIKKMLPIPIFQELRESMPNLFWILTFLLRRGFWCRSGVKGDEKCQTFFFPSPNKWQYINNVFSTLLLYSINELVSFHLLYNNGLLLHIININVNNIFSIKKLRQ